MEAPVISDKQYILYVSSNRWNNETREIVDIIHQYNLSNSVIIRQIEDDNIQESLKAIRGEEIKLPFLELVVLCETCAILGYMGKEEIIDVFRTYALI